jgi:hypothetical protein
MLLKDRPWNVKEERKEGYQGRKEGYEGMISRKEGWKDQERTKGRKEGRKERS